MLRSYGLAGVMTLVLLSGPALAFDVVRHDYGGRVEPYVARLAMAEGRGEAVRIGPVECDSSCTLFLGAANSCVSPGAVFGFHAPWIGGPNGGVVDRQMTALFASAYTPPLRKIFLRHVRNSHGRAPGPLLKITGAQLANYGYRLCSE